MMATVGWFAFWVLAVLFSGVVIQDMWSWFVVPLGAPPIGIAHGLGLRLTLSWCTAITRPNDDKFSEVVVRGACITAMVWGLGYLYSRFM